MQVQVYTDNNTQGSERFAQLVEDTVVASLKRFGTRITRVEVHLSDENGEKSRGDDKKCVLEARPANMKPVSVSHISATFDLAVAAAAKKMERHLDATFGRIEDRKGRAALGTDE